MAAEEEWTTVGKGGARRRAHHHKKASFGEKKSNAFRYGASSSAATATAGPTEEQLAERGLLAVRALLPKLWRTTFFGRLDAAVSKSCCAFISNKPLSQSVMDSTLTASTGAAGAATITTAVQTENCPAPAPPAPPATTPQTETEIESRTATETKIALETVIDIGTQAETASQDQAKIPSPAPAPAATDIEIVCYGLGSPVASANARLQLACVLLLRRALYSSVHPPSATVPPLPPASGLPIALFDPVLSAADRRLISALAPEVQVLAHDEAGKRSVRKPTLFFMPHCPMRLYSNLLWANWGASLANVLLVGNSLSGYGQRVMTPERRADTSNCVLRLLALENDANSCGSSAEQVPAGATMDEEFIECDRERNEPELQHELSRAFNDTSVQCFARMARIVAQLERPPEFTQNIDDGE